MNIIYFKDSLNNVKITSGGEGDGGGEVLTDDDKRGDCETSKCTDAGYVWVATVAICFGLEDGIDKVIGVGLDADIRL